MPRNNLQLRLFQHLLHLVSWVVAERTLAAAVEGILAADILAVGIPVAGTGCIPAEEHNHLVEAGTVPEVERIHVRPKDYVLVEVRRWFHLRSSLLRSSAR